MVGIFRKLGSVNSYLYRNFLAPRIYSFRDKEILNKNCSIRNIHKGKRCFLVGGGPSVADIDLTMLKNEYTFVMNEFDKNPQYSKLNPKFHMITDTLYFTEGSVEYWPEEFKRKSQNLPKNTTMFLGLGAKSFVEKHNLFSGHPVYYIGMQGIFTDNFAFNISLDKYVPYPKNSMLITLMTASYMGFSPIYLLGCEHNFLSYNIGSGKTLTYNHTYDDGTSKLDPNDEKTLSKFFRPKDLNQNYEKNIANVLQLFRNYKFFYAKAKKLYPGIEIYNATPDSFLDVFPMIKFEDIKF